MKYSILPLLIFLPSLLFSQQNGVSEPFRNEISTDLSGAFSNHFRIDFNRRGMDKMGAFVVGLRTRSESAGVTIDTNQMTRFSDRSLSIPQGQRALDVSVGVRYYIGLLQPQRGLWVQLTALTSLVQWQSGAYETARASSIYPEEYIKPKQMFGLEGDIGYRYLFDNGFSLNAHVSWTQLLLRSEFVSDRFPDFQRNNGGLDGALSGSFLTLGYVW